MLPNVIQINICIIYNIKNLGDNVDCWMEIQHGKGPWASVVNGIVPLGTTLTMVVGIKDKLGNIYSQTHSLRHVFFVRYKTKWSQKMIKRQGVSYLRDTLQNLQKTL